LGHHLLHALHAGPYPMKDNPRRQEYWARINRALDYIEAHKGDDLSLENIAKAAYFSPFHFHRIFRSLMGEPVQRFVQRTRLEHAAFVLRAHPNEPVTRIARRCGYGNPASFSRAFRAAFGASPKEWRAKGGELSKIGMMEGKIGKDGQELGPYPSGATMTVPHPEERSDMMSDKLKMEVRVEDLPELTLAYVRHVGPYAGDASLFEGLFNRLFQWAGPRGLLRFPETQVLCVYHDDPGVTVEEKLRMSVAITVPPDAEVSGEVGKMSLPGGRYAQARFELSPDQYEAAWNRVYGGWLPDSGYVPGDGLAFERYLGSPGDHPEGKHSVEICVPVKPL
jgi:AraC family transcriptional regulator